MALHPLSGAGHKTASFSNHAGGVCITCAFLFSYTCTYRRPVEATIDPSGLFLATTF